MKSSLPLKASVTGVLSSRYAASSRPAEWDRRISGIDKIETKEHGTISLNSDGSQSVPEPGWTIVLTDGDEQQGYRWTLYGIARQAPAQSAAAPH